MTSGLDPIDLELADEVLGLVERRRRDLNLRDYRRSVLRRRIESRMAVLSLREPRQYLHRLAEDLGEADALARHMRIRTSEFFRNRDVFRLLAERVLAQPPSGDRLLRAWSAGCANGQEAYSLAFLTGAHAVRWTILGTDVDLTAIATATSASYPRWAGEGLTDDECALLFGCRVAQTSTGPRRLLPPPCPVRFARHDLLRASDPPDGREFDLVLCRNVLIYLVAEAQQRVQELLSRSVRAGGFLCLGEAEALAHGVTARFRVVNARARLFQRI
jgi:two-component system CheB/CheR fusion protein